MIRFQQAGRGLGCDIYLTLCLPDKKQADEVFWELWAQIQQFNKRFSRFMAGSELTKVNINSGRPTQVSLEFRDLLKQSVRLGGYTDGVFNPFVLPALQSAGYLNSMEPGSSYVREADFRDKSSRHDVSSINIEGDSITIPRHSALDFGGIGKGYLLDNLAAYLNGNHIKNYWLSLGGDIVCKGFNLESAPWKIAIAPSPGLESIDTITNETGEQIAVATSGIAKRRGHGWHHIIDPRTSKPSVSDTVAASVVHPSATEADVYAKWLVILGSQNANSLSSKIGAEKVILQLHNHQTLKLKGAKVVK